ncbi:hypothetical protein Vqi01_45700 [Micromonospora qiuiae]|uniref:Uncharacterized protein n=1 Tax=Micromonospora qiuiae TaxID=502268 RepID=A0ABQ4JG33_9ACTN|nr:hypothetical protein [Micromonospora qiuiae]GIJ29408.1 hypothetical protein Vqi01_45700 [Micromonospora qiuiae]
MSSLAFARPMWPATLRAFRELTRLALATLVLAVALGATAATEAIPGIDLPAGPAAATVALRPAVEPAQSADARATRQERITAQERVTGPARPDVADARTAPVSAVPADLAIPRVAAGAGEPTRRGPPAA